MSTISNEFLSDVNTIPSWNLSDEQNLDECRKICQKVNVSMKEWLILVNIQTQTLHLLNQEKTIHSYLISTAANGPGQEEGSGKTPLGLHTIQEKIGDEAEPYAIFESRKNTGELAACNEAPMRIIARILRLGGLEDHFNKGNNLDGAVVDSYERYIYIHGTNDVQNIGKATSAGCVRMVPEQIIDLYNQIAKQSPVFIYKA